MCNKIKIHTQSTWTYNRIKSPFYSLKHKITDLIYQFKDVEFNCILHFKCSFWRKISPLRWRQKKVPNTVRFFINIIFIIFFCQFIYLKMYRRKKLEIKKKTTLCVNWSFFISFLCVKLIISIPNYHVLTNVIWLGERLSKNLMFVKNCNVCQRFFQ